MKNLKAFISASIGVLMIIYQMAHSENNKFDLSKLTDIQRQVTQDGATEPPFKDQYWDNKGPGFMWIFSAASLYLLLCISMTPEPDGLAS